MTSAKRLPLRAGFTVCVKLGIYHKAAVARTAKDLRMTPEELSRAMARSDRLAKRLRHRFYAEVVTMCGEKAGRSA